MQLTCWQITIHEHVNIFNSCSFSLCQSQVLCMCLTLVVLTVVMYRNSSKPSKMVSNAVSVVVLMYPHLNYIEVTWVCPILFINHFKVLMGNSYRSLPISIAVWYFYIRFPCLIFVLYLLPHFRLPISSWGLNNTHISQREHGKKIHRRKHSWV